MILLNTPEDIKWLYITALRKVETGLPPMESVGAAILEGNEDAPHRITLYADSDPMVNAKPLADYSIMSDEEGWNYVRNQ